MIHTERHRTEHIGWLRAAVLGANDGLISTSSLVVGVAAAQTDRGPVLLAATAGLVAGALSMAAGEYVSVSSQSDTEDADLARERTELATMPKHRRSPGMVVPQMRFHGCVRMLLCGLAISASAQSPKQTVVRVLSHGDQPVPFAWVSLNGGNPVTADSTGVAIIGVTSRDTATLRVRRMGYKPFDERVVRAPGTGVFTATMTPVAPTLDTVRVLAARMTPLASRGFYDRLERTKRGAFTAEFITPEELDARGAVFLSQMFEGRRSVRVGQMSSLHERAQTVLLGRGGCAMTILVDGQRITGSLQDAVVEAVPQSINPIGSRQPTKSSLRLGLDQIADVRAVMGIEIYPSTANAPVDLIPIGGRGSCGFVAIWTGARR